MSQSTGRGRGLEKFERGGTLRPAVCTAAEQEGGTGGRKGGMGNNDRPDKRTRGRAGQINRRIRPPAERPGTAALEMAPEKEDAAVQQFPRSNEFSLIAPHIICIPNERNPSQYNRTAAPHRTAHYCCWLLVGW